MSEQASELPTSFRVLLLGEASARPKGLERELTQAGFQLVEQENPEVCPAVDAILITLADLPNQPEAGLPGAAGQNHGLPPQLVVLSSTDPDGAATALALGAADVLVAPVHLPELCARLYARIREHRLVTSSANGRAAGNEEADRVRCELLERRVQEEFERARRYSLSFSLILLGVDELQDSRRQGDEGANHRQQP